MNIQTPDQLRQRRQRLLTRLAALRNELDDIDAELLEAQQNSAPKPSTTDTDTAQFPLPIAAG